VARAARAARRTRHRHESTRAKAICRVRDEPDNDRVALFVRVDIPMHEHPTMTTWQRPFADSTPEARSR